MEQKYKYDVVIIDPASTEFNRGSFCYLPYILYAQMKTENVNVCIIEDFTMAQLDRLPDADKYLVALWSYPQIDCCLALNWFIKAPVEFFGYYPLIKNKKLSMFYVDNDMVCQGIMHYHEYFDEFEFLLLSDCDMHLSKYSGQVYPLFTSYGCSNNCAFCPVSKNVSKRIIREENEVIHAIRTMHKNGIRNIHFTDEDFFFRPGRAYNILKAIEPLDMQLISLGSVKTVGRFLSMYGHEILVDAGMKIIEVGLETFDDSLNHAMLKPGADAYKQLAEEPAIRDGLIDIFWLTMTFFPGETIKSLNATGAFLSIYGQNVNDMYSRIQTNSTEGGLGQFYQLYDDCPQVKPGMMISRRQVRLMPSFVPMSYLESQIVQRRDFESTDLKWFQMYKLEHDQFQIQDGISIADFVRHPNIDIQRLVYSAICARLRII